MKESKLIWDKETDNKQRWEAKVGVLKTSFKLYIPTWRVPRPVPSAIHVIVDRADDQENPRAIKTVSRKDVSAGSTELDQPILAIVHLPGKPTETIRYSPLGEQDDWEIGEPYIPVTLLREPYPKFAHVTVRWDRR